LAAAADGVWIAYATGMMGAVEHRGATDLAMLVDPQYGHTNGIRVFVGGGALWFVDPGAGRLACADLRTGTTAASSQETLPAAIVADANGSYLGDSDGVGFLRPDPSCPY
jgi:sugar lactone lactonase YvrE